MPLRLAGVAGWPQLCAAVAGWDVALLARTFRAWRQRVAGRRSALKRGLAALRGNARARAKQGARVAHALAALRARAVFRGWRLLARLARARNALERCTMAALHAAFARWRVRAVAAHKLDGRAAEAAHAVRFLRLRTAVRALVLHRRAALVHDRRLIAVDALARLRAVDALRRWSRRAQTRVQRRALRAQSALVAAALDRIAARTRFRAQRAALFLWRRCVCMYICVRVSL